MVLGKEAIYEILCTDWQKYEEKLRKKENAILIRTETEINHFDRDAQIGTDSIDLSIGYTGYVISPTWSFINTLQKEDFNDYFEQVDLPDNGYKLEPGALLFIPSYERIAISGNLIGRVTGRSVFARMGLSIHCTQDKFASGINSVVGLQLVNNGPVALMIFPRQKVAQMILEDTSEMKAYDGAFKSEKTYTLPQVGENDRKQYDEQLLERILNRKPKRNMGLHTKTDSILALSICKSILAGLGIIFSAIFGATNKVMPLVVSIIFTLADETALSILELYLGRNSQ